MQVSLCTVSSAISAHWYDVSGFGNHWLIPIISYNLLSSFLNLTLVWHFFHEDKNGVMHTLRSLINFCSGTNQWLSHPLWSRLGFLSEFSTIGGFGQECSRELLKPFQVTSLMYLYKKTPINESIFSLYIFSLPTIFIPCSIWDDKPCAYTVQSLNLYCKRIVFHR